MAREGSFTRAAARRGLSQWSLSHRISDFEHRLGIRLLNRTTRSVAPTEAGARLLDEVAPRLDEIAGALGSLGDLRDRPTGTIRLTASSHAAEAVLWPIWADFLGKYPEVRLELTVDHDRVESPVALVERAAKSLLFNALPSPRHAG